MKVRVGEQCKSELRNGETEDSVLRFCQTVLEQNIEFQISVGLG